MQEGEDATLLAKKKRKQKGKPSKEKGKGKSKGKGKKKDGGPANGKNLRKSKDKGTENEEASAEAEIVASDETTKGNADDAKGKDIAKEGGGQKSPKKDKGKARDLGSSSSSPNVREHTKKLTRRSSLETHDTNISFASLDDIFSPRVTRRGTSPELPLFVLERGGITTAASIGNSDKPSSSSLETSSSSTTRAERRKSLLGIIRREHHARDKGKEKDNHNEEHAAAKRATDSAKDLQPRRRNTTANEPNFPSNLRKSGSEIVGRGRAVRKGEILESSVPPRTSTGSVLGTNGSAFLSGISSSGLLTAVRLGDRAKVQQLLDAGADPNERTISGNNAFHVAAKKGHFHLLRLLYERGCLINQGNCQKQTPLMLAASQGLTKTVAALLALGAKEALNVQDEKGRTALQLTIMYAGRGSLGLDVVRLLTSFPETKVNVQDNDGSTALQLALARAAKLQDDQRTLEPFASEDALVKESGTQINGRPSSSSSASSTSSGASADEAATIPAYMRVVRFLLTLPAEKKHSASAVPSPEKSSKKKRGNTKTSALVGTSAASVASSGEVELLSQRSSPSTAIVATKPQGRVNVNLSNSKGMTALHIAASRGLTMAVCWLCELGAQVEKKDGLGRTPLHHAAQDRQLEAVNALLHFGANIDAQDTQGHKPQDLALDPRVRSVLRHYTRGKVGTPKKTNCAGAPPTKIRNLVFQGGGLKGFAFVGAVRALEDVTSKSLAWKSIRRLGGTGTGALIAALLGVGYTAAEVEETIRDLNVATSWFDGELGDCLTELKGKMNPHHSDVRILLESASEKVQKHLHSRNGLFEGESLRLWIENLIERKTGIKFATFDDVHKLKTSGRTTKEMHFTGTNLTTGKQQIFSLEATPHAVLSDVLRISMSAPFVFSPHQLHVKLSGARMLEPSMQEYLFADGALLDDFPIWLFDDWKFRSKGSHPVESTYAGFPPGKDEHLKNFATLGFRVVDYDHDGDQEVEGEAEVISNWPRKKRGRPLSFKHAPAKNCNALFWNALKCSSLHTTPFSRGADEMRTVTVDSLGTDFREFTISDADKEALLYAGRLAMQAFVSRSPVIHAHRFALSADTLNLCAKYFKQYSVDLAPNGLTVTNIVLESKCADLIDTLFTRGNEQEIDFVKALELQGLLSINATDSSGNTALHLVAQRGDADAVKRLVRAGAALDVKNRQQQTPLDVALLFTPPQGGGGEDRKVKRKKSTIVSFMLKKGARKCARESLDEIVGLCQGLLESVEDKRLEKALSELKSNS